MSTMKKVFTLEGISYPLNTEKPEFVPEAKDFLKGAVDSRNLKAVMASLNLEPPVPVLFEGPTGSGKTATVRWLASQTKNSYRRIQLNGSTNIDNFVGKWLINEKGTYWVDGILTDAMKKGHWLLLDELNAALPEILFVLHSILDDDRCLILDDKGKEIVEPHPNFRLFAAMNPSQDYAGTKELNRALLDRFMLIQSGYLASDKEGKIVSKHSGITSTLGKIGGRGKTVISRMVELANIIRTKNESAELISICSTRQLIQWSKLCKYLDIKHAAELTIINKCDVEEQERVRDELNKLFTNDETLQKHLDKEEAYKEKEKELAKIAPSLPGISTSDTLIDPDMLKAITIAAKTIADAEIVNDTF
jgi:midasin (ATPase involved in ribosome maturation)